MAGYDADGLPWVVPHTDGDEHVSVQHELDELARRPSSPPGDATERELVEAE